MKEETIRELLEAVREGRESVEQALQQMCRPPFEDLGFAKIDLDRTARCGVPEVIFCSGKTPQQVREIAARLNAAGDDVLATRASPEHYQAIREALPEAEYREPARCVVARYGEPPALKGMVLVLTAGTSDLPVAHEAVVTAEMLGSRVDLISDVGVAGIHRVLNYAERLRLANVLVVVAGMEGALASVVAGLVSRPVIGVPTSVGYGASFGGIAPLLTMLNSCAAGVAVVNIDNGFGAGYVASLINRMAVEHAEDKEAEDRAHD